MKNFNRLHFNTYNFSTNITTYFFDQVLLRTNVKTSYQEIHSKKAMKLYFACTAQCVIAFRWIIFLIKIQLTGCIHGYVILSLSIAGTHSFWPQRLHLLLCANSSQFPQLVQAYFPWLVISSDFLLYSFGNTGNPGLTLSSG
ncbi:hypothetical protein SAMN05444144_10332 [Flavobacterium akiainvivens]|nr:hypothetical protein SAMN05444144_10332 [Flavobacterium akiainvivens]